MNELGRNEERHESEIKSDEISLYVGTFGPFNSNEIYAIALKQVGYPIRIVKVEPKDESDIVLFRVIEKKSCKSQIEEIIKKSWDSPILKIIRGVDQPEMHEYIDDLVAFTYMEGIVFPEDPAIDHEFLERCLLQATSRALKHDGESYERYGSNWEEIRKFWHLQRMEKYRNIKNNLESNHVRPVNPEEIGFRLIKTFEKFQQEDPSLLPENPTDRD